MVILLTHTSEPDKLVAMAARLCYSSKDFSTLEESLTQEKIDKLLNSLVDAGHMSPFEHVNFTFAISDISRAASHQLVRHRLASYSQQSLRYTEAKETNFNIPRNMKHSDNALMEESYRQSFDMYKLLLEHGVEPESARYVLPQGVTSNIIVTMNARELMNFFRLRCCRRAQDEIRMIANAMLSQCKDVAPIIFKKAGAPCAAGGECPEGEHKHPMCKKLDKFNSGYTIVNVEEDKF